MLIRTQQLLFDLILFIYSLVAMLFVARIVWITKNKLNESFKFLLITIFVWSLVKLLDIMIDLRILNIYVVSIGELFFITLFIAGTWYTKHLFLTSKHKKKKVK